MQTTPSTTDRVATLKRLRTEARRADRLTKKCERRADRLQARHDLADEHYCAGEKRVTAEQVEAARLAADAAFAEWEAAINAECALWGEIARLDTEERAERKAARAALKQLDAQLRALGIQRSGPMRIVDEDALDGYPGDERDEADLEADAVPLDVLAETDPGALGYEPDAHWLN